MRRIIEATLSAYMRDPKLIHAFIYIYARARACLCLCMRECGALGRLLCIRNEQIKFKFSLFIRHFNVFCLFNFYTDDHDVKYFLTHSLHAERLQTTVVNKTTIGAEDKQKLEEKYTEFQQKLDTQREQ